MRRTGSSSARRSSRCRNFTWPHMEMAVACARSPPGGLAAGPARARHALHRGTSPEALEAHANNWKLCERAAAENGKTVDRGNWRIVTLAHIAETREQAYRNVEFGLELWAQYFREIATFRSCRRRSTTRSPS